MKKFFLGSVAVAIAIAGVAFTTPNNKKANPYWFIASNSTTTLTSVTLNTSAPTQSATDPFSCSGITDYCSLAFNNFVQSGGVYQPSNDGVNALTQSQYDDAGILKGSALKN